MAQAEAARTSARAKLLGWARRSIDLIPTSWLLTGAGAILLAATAIFGGLEAAAVDPTPEVAVGEMFAGSDLEMTVVGVELREERGNAGLSPDEEKDERLLVVVVDVVNTFPIPRPAASGKTVSPVIDGILIDGLDAKATVSLAEDGEGSPMLQPDVPARLLLTWIVAPDDYEEGDEILLTLPDSIHYVGKNVTRGDYWADVVVGATVTTDLVEVPAAVDEVVMP
ncbi:hypothetical protein RS85_00195 [Microbacterium sp. SA39]|nr:hypothetical protein RS85_00195 [Microbacterium sp. SA39]